jgi:hypothetical protein
LRGIGFGAAGSGAAASSLSEPSAAESGDAVAFDLLAPGDGGTCFEGAGVLSVTGFWEALAGAEGCEFDPFAETGDDDDDDCGALPWSALPWFAPVGFAFELAAGVVAPLET